MRVRRVGTITLGLSLLSFGCLFLLKLFGIAISYEFIMQLWPVIFIFLGCEILFSHLKGSQEQFKYDFGAIVILAMLTIFSIGMACIEMTMKYADYYVRLKL